METYRQEGMYWLKTVTKKRLADLDTPIVIVGKNEFGLGDEPLVAVVPYADFMRFQGYCRALADIGHAIIQEDLQ